MSLPSGFSIKHDYVQREREDWIVAYIESLGGAPIGGRTVFRFGRNCVPPFEKIGLVPCALYDNKDLWQHEVVTANVYEPGAKVTAHIDASSFDEPICILSLLNEAVMRLTSPSGMDVDVKIPRRSLVVLTGDALHRWQHAIEETDGRRISIVYRMLKHSVWRKCIVAEAKEMMR